MFLLLKLKDSAHMRKKKRETEEQKNREMSNNEFRSWELDIRYSLFLQPPRLYVHNSHTNVD